MQIWCIICGTYSKGDNGMNKEKLEKVKENIINNKKELPLKEYLYDYLIMNYMKCYTIPGEVNVVIEAPEDPDVYDGYCYGAFVDKENLPEACILVCKKDENVKKELMNIIEVDKKYRKIKLKKF